MLHWKTKYNQIIFFCIFFKLVSWQVWKRTEKEFIRFESSKPNINRINLEEESEATGVQTCPQVYITGHIIMIWPVQEIKCKTVTTKKIHKVGSKS